MQVKLIWSNNDYSETWTISRAGLENNGSASLYRQSAPGQGYEDKIRTFLADIVSGSSRWRKVPVGALASRPIMHRSWPTEETVCSVLADYSICVTREAEISLCVHAVFILPHVQRHSFMLIEREVCKCGFTGAQLVVVRSKTKSQVQITFKLIELASVPLHSDLGSVCQYPNGS